MHYIILILTVIYAVHASNPLQQEDNRAADKTIILVRHAETCITDDSDPTLSPEGVQRAADLVRALEFFDIQKIYSTPLQRTLETAAPIAANRGLTVVETPISKTFLDDLAVQLLADQEEVILVSGHSNTTPVLVNKIAETNLDLIDESEYDHLFVVSIGEGTPQLQRFRYGSPSGSPVVCE